MSHRKARSRTAKPSPAVGLTTAAIASVGLLSAQPAQATPNDPTPTVEEVQKKIDALYRQAGTRTQRYNTAQQAATDKRRQVEEVRDDHATRAERLSELLRAGDPATRYRSASNSPTGRSLFTEAPPTAGDQADAQHRMSDRQRGVPADAGSGSAQAAGQRVRVAERPESLTRSQGVLRAGKHSVQSKLAEARTLMSRWDADARTRLLAVEQEQAIALRRATEEAARQQASARTMEGAELRRLEQQRRQHPSFQPTTGASAAAKAERVLAFARAQVGKPYGWGATGPSSYDGSGLTRAAWRAVGVDLPRTAAAQATVGQRVGTRDLRPGDLVFYSVDHSHVGVYVGDGKMIHAPRPGADRRAGVRVESIYTMPIQGSVRPA
ncbi:C40 family peptidase [Streptomyces albipurpureus]|uniref:C40 family peptidase n=1 Tax=Streptomyces albipurpureus TaxID=2897419 RepID=UPI0027E506F9|nr:C40 family peptidase [Streptomyces sp. CWNU-1]